MKQITRRLLGIFLTLCMVLGTLSGTGITVFAEETEPKRELIFNMASGEYRLPGYGEYYLNMIARSGDLIVGSDLGSKKVYKNKSGKELFQYTETTFMTKIIEKVTAFEGITSSDNVTHIITDDDREYLKKIVLQDPLKDYNKISVIFPNDNIKWKENNSIVMKNLHADCKLYIGDIYIDGEGVNNEGGYLEEIAASDCSVDSEGNTSFSPWKYVKKYIQGTETKQYTIKVVETYGGLKRKYVSYFYTPEIEWSFSKKLAKPENVEWDGKIVSWSEVEGATDYEIALEQKDGTKVAKYTVKATDAGELNQYDFSKDVKEGEYYKVSVRATSEKDDCLDSNTVYGYPALTIQIPSWGCTKKDLGTEAEMRFDDLVSSGRLVTKTDKNDSNIIHYYGENNTDKELFWINHKTEEIAVLEGVGSADKVSYIYPKSDREEKGYSKVTIAFSDRPAGDVSIDLRSGKSECKDWTSIQTKGLQFLVENKILEQKLIGDDLYSVVNGSGKELFQYNKKDETITVVKDITEADNIVYAITDTDRKTLLKEKYEKIFDAYATISILFGTTGAEIIKPVLVTGGKAMVEEKTVTTAAKGTLVYLVEDKAPEGKKFTGWKVISGSVTLVTAADGKSTSFVMGEEAVEITAKYEDIKEPAATVTPAVSGTPKASATPVVSGAPEASVTPAVSGVPGVSATPAVSGVPRASATPTVSGVPGASGAPAVSGAPEASGAPAVSGAPEASGAPTVSGAPAVSGAPEASGAPAVSRAPEASAAPAVSGAPGASGTPAVSGAPGASGIPAVSGAPATSATPEASTAPETHIHKLVSVPKKAATFTEDGIKAHYSCSECDKCFADAAAKLEIKDKTNLVIAKVSNVQISEKSTIYNGKVQTPQIVLEDSEGKILVEGTDYTINYGKGRKNVGTYEAEIVLQENYSGTQKLFFTIKPKTSSLSSVKAEKKKITVKWKKQTSQTTGYQIQYATDNKFKSAKTATVNKNTMTSQTITKLKAKKKYYIRIRTYKTTKYNGKTVKIYSDWSKAKSVKTK